MSKSVNIILAIIVLIAFIYVYGLLNNDLELKGMEAVYENPQQFSNEESTILKNNIVFEIDLSNLESNKGLEVYNDGENKVLIKEVGKNDSIGTGGYYISFEAVASSSSEKVTLVSLIENRNAELGKVTPVLVSKLYATYKGKQYECPLYGFVSYGTIVSFYLFPTDAYEDDGLSLDEVGSVELELIDLYKNIWRKID